MIKNNLKDILDSRGIKYSFIADNIGMTRASFSNLINNKFSTSLEFAFKISKILDMRIEEIFYEYKS